MVSPVSLRQLAEEDFFSLIGMQSMSQADKEDMLKTINETVQARAYLMIYEQLSAEDRKAMDAVPVEELVAFLAEKGFDLTQLILEESLKYRFELATMFKLAVGGPQLATAA